MIAGIFLRNFKIYQGINYIPLSLGNQFSSIIGQNGAGKSSILEALDSYFNKAEWNLNHSLSKGFQEREPFICPLFLIEKTRLNSKSEHKWYYEGISETAWNTSLSNFNSSSRQTTEAFISHRERLKSEGYYESHYLIPFGQIKNTHTSSPDLYFSIFEGTEAFTKLNRYAQAAKAKTALLEYIDQKYKYIYIPSEVNYKEYTKIEGRTIQALLGKKIDDIVRDSIKKGTIQEINRNLNNFLSDVSKKLGNYEYKKPARKQNLFNQSHLTEKIIETFFESKVLTKKTEKDYTPVTNLSSGEKRKALIDVASGFLLSATPEPGQQTILAIDEPELSLHISSCFAQFEKIKQINKSNVQTFIATHWHGFMPAITHGSATYCSISDEPSRIIDLRCFRDEIKRIKEQTKGRLPIEIELKGLNDLIQAITSSITESNQSWIICEGITDRFYLEFYLTKDQPYILPVGGSKYVKKIYNLLTISLEENKESIKGKVFHLLDTDKKVDRFDSKDSIDKIIIRRLLNCEKEKITKLLKTTDDDHYPPTVVEDALDAKAFIETLKHFSNHENYGSKVSTLLPKIEIAHYNWPSRAAINLTPTDALLLEEIFQQEQFKRKFAEHYTKIANTDNKPAWIHEIENFFNTPNLKKRK